jgi:hypothetical protein
MGRLLAALAIASLTLTDTLNCQTKGASTVCTDPGGDATGWGIGGTFDTNESARRGDGSASPHDQHQEKPKK